MTSDIEPNSHLKTVAIVFVVALILLSIQSCRESSQACVFSNEQIIQIGRNRLLLGSDDPGKININIEAVIRPGRNGGEFGYWAQYQVLNAAGEWVKKEHYDE